MKKNKGSAIVIVLLSLIVLLVFAVSVMDNRTKRAGLRKYMSDEKKAEAFAEAVLDRVIADIREKANDDQETVIYNLLREKSSYANPGVGEKNQVVSMTVQELIPTDYYSSIESAFTDEGGTYKISDDVKAEIVHVENFGGEYQVVGVDVMPESPETYVKSSGEADPSKDNWKFSLMYPTTTKSDVESINAAYADKYDTGIFNAYSQTQVSGIDSKYMGYKYVSPRIDIDLDLSQGLKDAIENYATVGAENFEKTYVDLLLKDTSDTNKKTAMEFGVYISDELYQNIYDMLDKIVEDYDDSKIGAFGAWITGNSDVVEKVKEVRDGILKDSETFNKEVNEKLHSFISENGAANEFIENGNTINLEKIMTEKVSAFKDLGALLPSKMLNAIGGGGSISDDWLSKAKPQGDLDSNLIEKGGILRLTCKVEYTPKDKSPIKKKLVTEIPFKVSDVQPIAPEYTFFVNNSSSDVSCGDGATVKLVGDSESAGSPDEIFVLNNGNRLDGKDFDSGSKKIIPYKSWASDAPCAGKVRINGEDLGEDNIIPTNCGGLEDGEFGLSDMPMLCVAKSEVKDYPYKSNLQLKVTFGFAEGQGNSGTALKPTKIHFPTLAGVEKALQGPLTGFESIVKMFEGCATSNILDKPTYLYGYGHLDYPLGITVEGKVESSLSELYAHLYPKMTFSVDINEDGFKFEPKGGKLDGEFQIWYEIKDKNDFPTNEATKITYGLPNINADKTPLKAYNPESPENWPDFLYSDLQYKKKASRYYKNQSGFDSDCGVDVKEGGLKDGDNIRLDGVIYIEGEKVTLGNKTFVGSGIIVAEENMTINGNIELADNNGKNSSLGLIARKGSMEIIECEVNASCYSNAAPTLTAATIKGNLVTNSFDRSNVTGVTNIVYCSKNIVVPDTDFSDLYKQNPKRYFASFANNWSKSYYDKNVDE